MAATQVPEIPDDQTITEFIFGNHEIRPWRRQGIPWLIDDETGREFSREELKARAESLSGALQATFDLKPKDIVVLFSGNHIDYPICVWATHLFHGTVASTNPGFTAPELDNHLRSLNASLIITRTDVLHVVEEAAKKAGLPRDRIVTIDENTQGFQSVPDLLSQGRALTKEYRFAKGDNKDHIAFLNHSSGTTGAPKIIKISHHSAIANVLLQAAHNQVHLNYAKWSERRYRPGDICLTPLPLYHIYGVNVSLHYNLFAGLSVIFSTKFDMENILNNIVRYNVTHLMVAPPHLVVMSKHPLTKEYDLSSIRVILSDGSVLPMELYKQLVALLPDAHIGQAYGATEYTGIAAMHSINDKRNPHGGVFVPGVSGKVLKPDGSLAGPDEEGELYIKTPSSSSGYLNNETAHKSTFSEDGWIRSGDIVRIDHDGNLIIIDRAKEMLKVGAHQVSPTELEGAILVSPLTDDVCVAALPDAQSGELPIAFVVPSQTAKQMIDRGEEDAAKDQLMQLVAQSKPSHKHLARVEFVDSIPKLPSGKPLRRELRDRARRMALDSASY